MSKIKCESTGSLRTVLTILSLCYINQSGAFAQTAVLPPTITYIPGSSIKLEQLIGDCDWAVMAAKGTCLPTTSQTVTRFNILGNGFGYSFEDNGKMLFLFGDTISKDVTAVNYHAHDPIAQSTATDPESGLLLNFFTNSDGTPLFTEPPGIAMGADDIANSGISLPDGVYLVCNTGADESLADPHQNAYSILTRFDETAKTFATGRTISRLPGGHFIFTSLHASGSDVYMWGMGNYRASDIYLSKTPAGGFWAGTGTQYFAGLVNGQPIWTNAESGAVPVVQDNPLNGPAWPNDNPTVGNLSAGYSASLGLWLMTFDGGRQTSKTRGVYFSYAQQPYGPWSNPQLVYNEVRDNGLGVYIHNPNIVPDPPGDGLNGPVIGNNDPYATVGGDFAPLLIERFTRVVGSNLTIYYTMSTWNPYTVVKMRSVFTITPTPQINQGGVVIHGSAVTTASPGSLVDIYGINLAAAPASATAGKLPVTLGGDQVLINGTAVPLIYVGPLQVIVQLPYETPLGAASVIVVSNGASSTPVSLTVQQAAPDILTYAINRAVVINPDGSLNGHGNGAKPGSVMVAYMTGSGPLDNPIATGSPAPLAPLSREKLATTVSIGGLSAIVQYPGMTPGLVGVMQVNFVIPNLATGDYPMQVAIGGTPGNQPLMTVSP